MKMSADIRTQPFQPDSLYHLATVTTTNHFSKLRNKCKYLPNHILFDVFIELSHNGSLCQLGMELMDLTTFERILEITGRRNKLYNCFQKLMVHGTELATALVQSLHEKIVACYAIGFTNTEWSLRRLVRLSWRLGCFLIDAGWTNQVEMVFEDLIALADHIPEPGRSELKVQALNQRLQIDCIKCKYQSASTCAARLQDLLPNVFSSPLISRCYASLCSYLMGASQFEEAFRVSNKAMETLSPQLGYKTVIEVLRSCSKICVAKRKFELGKFLIYQAVAIARFEFSECDPKLAEVLSDLGFYYLNIDAVQESVDVYNRCVEVLRFIFGTRNVNVALALEDLAYATYVLEYSSGNFDEARDLAECAVEVFVELLGEESLLAASAQRVKALILEEIAIDSPLKEVQESLLQEAHQLHLRSLDLVRQEFGDESLLTAKHYGNLGRLYQTMKRYPQAEEMHKRAIEIKEKLLGPDDYEVALSIGHLASLYNYDMKKYEEAELLYLRSIDIGIRLLGNTYSGLEYDYRGLIKLYSKTQQYQKLLHYQSIYDEYKQCVLIKMSQSRDSTVDSVSPMTVDEIKSEYFRLLST